jgi:hypothetical protein
MVHTGFVALRHEIFADQVEQVLDLAVAFGFAPLFHRRRLDLGAHPLPGTPDRFELPAAVEHALPVSEDRSDRLGFTQVHRRY